MPFIVCEAISLRYSSVKALRSEGDFVLNMEISRRSVTGVIVSANTLIRMPMPRFIESGSWRFW